MKRIYLVSILFFTVNSFCQSNEFSIEFNHSNPIRVFSEVQIYIKKKENTISVFVRSGNSGSKSYKITIEEFEHLKSKIFSIKPQDLIRDDQGDRCLDSGKTTIEFGEAEYLNSFSVKYAVDCLQSQDEKTPRKDFLEAVKLILELSKLKLEDLH